MNVTELERKALVAIRDCEFHDGKHPVDNYVWTDVVSDTVGGGLTFSGVASSLQKKGLARFQGEGKDAVVAITLAGFEAVSSG